MNLLVSQFSAITVGIEKPDYQVAEEAGSILVCAVIRDPHDASCPVDFSISFILLTSDDSAGTANIIAPSCISVHTFYRILVNGQL